ncbi:MAG: triosephosphate isomerase [Anaerolineae bacterium]|nr:triosephosphate isomerase [Anaerolineae bacterium]
MTIEQTGQFVRDFLPLVEDMCDQVEIVICPPYTAVRDLAAALSGSGITVAGQDLWVGPGEAHTGAISGPLLADAGAAWVMVGHWEVRRRLGLRKWLGYGDFVVNQQIHAALATGLRPIILIGEEYDDIFDPSRLALLLDGCSGEQVEQMILAYEPEGAIGHTEPVSPQHAADGCQAIRHWLVSQYGQEATAQARIIYGGSVPPQHAQDLLANPNVDGLGTSRQGRNPFSFAAIVRRIAESKGE